MRQFFLSLLQHSSAVLLLTAKRYDFAFKMPANSPGSAHIEEKILMQVHLNMVVKSIHTEEMKGVKTSKVL